MVRDGLADETGAKAIEQRGIDFSPTEEFIQSLRTAGASDAFIAALRAAKHPEPSNAQKPINQVQVFALLAGQVPSHRVAVLVEERGIDFVPDDEYLREVRLAGGEDELVSALKGAKVTKPATVDPAAQGRQAEVRQHVTRMAEMERVGRYTEAEQECRLALALDPQNTELRDDLDYILGQHTTARQYYSELMERTPPAKFMSGEHDPLSEFRYGGFACFPENPIWNSQAKKFENVEHTDFFLLADPFWLERKPLVTDAEFLKSQREGDLAMWHIFLSQLQLPEPDIESLLKTGFVLLSWYDKGVEVDPGFCILRRDADVYVADGYPVGRLGERARFEILLANVLAPTAPAAKARTRLSMNWQTLRFTLTVQFKQPNRQEWIDMLNDPDYGTCEEIPQPPR
jgi:hypothetical protein